MPLITLPYLIKVIGIKNYGAYSIVFAMIQYVILISAYGFGYSTTKQISQNRDNIKLINDIFNATLISRIIIAIIVILPMYFVCRLFYPIEYTQMFLWGLGMVIGDVLNPVWLYQGMEKMRFMTIVNLISKVLFTLLIFVIIRKESDYVLVTLLNSLGFIVSGIVSFIFASKIFKMRLYFPDVFHIKSQLRNGWYIFLSTISMNLYRNSNIFILSFFVDEAIVGIYSGAEKVIKASQAVVNPISNALFPYVAKSFTSASTANKLSMIFRLCKYMTIFLIGLALGTYIFAPFINSLLLDNVDGAVVLIKIMCPVVLLGGLNYIIGIVGLVNLNAQRSFFIYVTISGIISIIMLLFATPIIGVKAAAYSMSLSELILFCLCFYKILEFRKN